MEKTDFLKIVKNKFKTLGFRFKGNRGYKMIDNDYIVGICLEHHSYCNGYYIDYGVVYLPDDEKYPFRGWFDWSSEFLFTKNMNDDLAHYDITDLKDYDNNLINYFAYDLRNCEDLLYQIDINIESRLKLIFKKEIVLKYYRENLDMLAILPNQTLAKILELYNFDKTAVNCYRKQWGYDKYDF